MAPAFPLRKKGQPGWPPLGKDDLPARFRYAGDEPVRSEFTEGDTRKLEAANEAMAATAGLAAIHQTHRAGIAGQLRKANVIAFCLEFSTERCVFIDNARFFFSFSIQLVFGIRER